MMRWMGLAASLLAATNACAVFPGKEWETRETASVGLDKTALDAMAVYMGGRGCVVRGGYLVYTWGDAAERGDVASACKPWITHFLMRAIEEGKLKSPDVRVAEYVPCLETLNADLNHKDAAITFAHMANQISCYGVREAPGTAFDYNDWQMALYFDALFLKVYKTTYAALDDEVLHKRLTDALECQDNPTFFAFHKEGRAGRVGVSPRDFARFGLLYLNKGNWNGNQLLAAEHVALVTQHPLSNDIPRTKGEAAQMCDGQRSMGSEKVPDNQTEHDGSYSWTWWVNGVDRAGKRHFPDAPNDMFAALGHKNGMRGMAVFPSLDLIVSYNDTTLGERESKEGPLNEAFRLLMVALKNETAAR